MLREIIIPDSEHYDLHIPKEYINQSVEILVLPLSERDDDSQNLGGLHKEDEFENQQVLQQLCQNKGVDFIDELVNNPMHLSDGISFLSREEANAR